jgi:hypothetical protein
MHSVGYMCSIVAVSSVALTPSTRTTNTNTITCTEPKHSGAHCLFVLLLHFTCIIQFTAAAAVAVIVET